MPRRSAKRTIAVVTTSRSDFAHLRWLLHDLSKHPSVNLRLISLGPHLAPEFGRTGTEVAEHFRMTTVECLLSSDSDVGMAKTLGVATLGMADALAKMQPDLLLLIADRYEMLAPACVALTLRIPIATSKVASFPASPSTIPCATLSPRWRTFTSRARIRHAHV